MKLFFCAYNIKIGGGAILLSSLLNALPVSDSVVFILVNKSIDLPKNIPNNYKIIIANSNLFSRLYFEFWLLFKVCANDQVLFFGNYPPIFKLKGRVKVFLQNRFLVGDAPSVSYSSQFICKLVLQKFLFKICVSHVNEFFVQTRSMAELLSKFIHSEENISISILPFIAKSNYLTVSGEEYFPSHEFDFIYVASGESHKNHKALIQAWIILAGKGYFPSLVLTIDPFIYPDLNNFIQVQTANYNLNITNLGFLDMVKIQEVYSKSKALIFPSLLESFGLPLLEAKSLNLAILASELDYVRDVVDPDVTFDPLSPLSISRAVQRFLGIKETSISKVSPEQFLEVTLGLH
jgi:glycosyltransferase involved in cell wall biosynthesis